MLPPFCNRIWFRPSPSAGPARTGRAADTSATIRVASVETERRSRHVGGGDRATIAPSGVLPEGKGKRAEPIVRTPAFREGRREGVGPTTPGYQGFIEVLRQEDLPQGLCAMGMVGFRSLLDGNRQGRIRGEDGTACYQKGHRQIGRYLENIHQMMKEPISCAGSASSAIV